jgi:hypothetical protein
MKARDNKSLPQGASCDSVPGLLLLSGSADRFVGLIRIREALPVDDLAVMQSVELGVALVHVQAAVGQPAVLGAAELPGAT